MNEYDKWVQKVRKAISRNCRMIIFSSRGSGKSQMNPFYKASLEGLADKKKDDKVKVVFT